MKIGYPVETLIKQQWNEHVMPALGSAWGGLNENDRVIARYAYSLGHGSAVSEYETQATVAKNSLDRLDTERITCAVMGMALEGVPPFFVSSVRAVVNSVVRETLSHVLSTKSPTPTVDYEQVVKEARRRLDGCEHTEAEFVACVHHVLQERAL